MLKTIRVIHLAPGESLLILSDPGPKPVPPSDGVAAQSVPFLSDFPDDEKIIALVHVA